MDVVSAVWLLLFLIFQVNIPGFGGQLLDVLSLGPYLGIVLLPEGIVLGYVGQNPGNVGNACPLQVVALNGRYVVFQLIQLVFVVEVQGGASAGDDEPGAIVVGDGEHPTG